MIDWTGFDVPELRKNIDKPEDARWILRNLGIRNSKHPRFKEVINQCKDIDRKDFYRRNQDWMKLCVVVGHWSEEIE